MYVCIKKKYLYVYMYMSMCVCQDREVEKEYVALLEGHLPDSIPSEGEISLPLKPDWHNRPLSKVDYDSGKPCLTRYLVLSRDEWYTNPCEEGAKPIPCSRVRFIPVTGRSHQLRIHSAHPDGLGHPILGDTLYGNPDNAHRLMLHAGVLTFRHPVLGTPVRVEADPEFFEPTTLHPCCTEPSSPSDPDGGDGDGGGASSSAPPP